MYCSPLSFDLLVNEYLLRSKNNYNHVLVFSVCNMNTLFTANNSKFLADFGIRNGSRLQADDFLQDYTLLINILHTYVALAVWISAFESRNERHCPRLNVSILFL